MNKKTPIKLTREMLPGQAFHPGELLLDEISYRQLTQKELSEQMGIAPNVLNEFLHGKRNLTAAFAMKLEKALDIDAAYLMRLQVKYEIDTLRLGETNVKPPKQQSLYRIKTKPSSAAEPKTAYRKRKP